MWQGFTIALREGLEAFLIVALTLAYLSRTGRKHLARAVVAGIATSIAVCALAGFGLSKAANHSLWEGLLAAVAALLIGSFLVYMLRTAKRLKSDMERRIESHATFWGVFLFTVLMITREGMEATMLLVTALFQVKEVPWALVTGVGLGLVGAAAVALTWKQLGRAVNLGVLLNVLALFLAVFLLQLCLYAFHELAEAGILPNAQAIHDATEILGPDGTVGHLLTYLLAAVPTTWLAWSWLRGRKSLAVAQTQPQTSTSPRAA